MQRTVRVLAALAQALRAGHRARVLVGIALLAALCGGCASTPSAPNADDDVRALAGALDAADLGPLLAEWARQPSVSALRRCVLERWRPSADGAAAASGTEAAWPRGAADGAITTLAVSAAFAEVWRGQLLGELAADEAEALLARLLAGVSIEQHAGLREAIDPQLLGAALGRTLAGEGVHAAVARRGPVLDLLLWRGDEVRRYDVALPDGRIEVQVRLLDDVLVQGMRAWASCDALPTLAPAMGIATEWDDGSQLLLARDAVDTDGEHFRAHVLARAAQRRWDDARLPRLDEAERHYRIALAELARAESDDYARAALAGLARVAGQGRGDPHAHAAWAVLQALATPPARVDLRSVHAPALRLAAEGLLRASTAHALAVQHGERVHFLPD